MPLERLQGFTIIWLSVALTAISILIVLLTSLWLGAGIGILSALIVSVCSLFIYITALLYSTESFPLSRPRREPQPASRIKGLLLTQKNHPFTIRRGTDSDIKIEWKPPASKTTYLMSIQLDEKTHTCTFTEEIRAPHASSRLGSTTPARSSLVPTHDLYTPRLWPSLSGGKAFDPHEARRILWDICEKNGWSVMRK